MKKLQQSFDKKINNKFICNGGNTNEDERFDILSTQLQNALSSQSSYIEPLPIMAPLPLPSFELRLTLRRLTSTTSKPELRLPHQKKSFNSLPQRATNDDIIDSVSYGDLESDYIVSLEDPVTNFHEHVNYIRSITPPLITQNSTAVSSNGNDFIDRNFNINEDIPLLIRVEEALYSLLVEFMRLLLEEIIFIPLVFSSPNHLNNSLQKLNTKNT